MCPRELKKRNLSSLVSVIVAIYNVEAFLPKCIDSIISQHYQNLEILLVDDGSTDKSASIIDYYQKQDSRVKAIHEPNAGPAKCRNTGIENATGDFIVFVDGDDYLEPDYVDYMLGIQQQTNTDMVASRNCFFTGDSKQVIDDDIVVMSPDEATAEFFYPRIRLGAWNKMYRRSFLIENNLHFIEEFRAGEGLQFITAAATISNGVGMGCRKVYHYRINNAGSATSKPDVERQGIGALNTVQYITEHLPIHSQRVRNALNWHRWNTYGYCLRNIVAANEQKKFHCLYRTCIAQRRLGLPVVLRANVSLKSKVMAFAIFISPTAFARLEQTKIQNHLKTLRD